MDDTLQKIIDGYFDRILDIIAELPVTYEEQSDIFRNVNDHFYTDDYDNKGNLISHIRTEKEAQEYFNRFKKRILGIKYRDEINKTKKWTDALNNIEPKQAVEKIEKQLYQLNKKILLFEIERKDINDWLRWLKKYLTNEIDFHKKRTPTKKMFPGKQKTTFKTTPSGTNLKTLFTGLTDAKLLPPETNYKLFEAVFLGVPVNTLSSKIEWLGANNLLAYFIDELYNKRYIEIPVNHWDIAKHCFTNSDNLRQAKDRYENSKTGHPKQAPVIDTILKKVYNGLQ